ncbi:MAG TPA: hypothetical protein VKX16_00060 [Chloroflexota bacterium]|nr:hypothetical protein [Chloroflexota bacterium]
MAGHDESQNPIWAQAKARKQMDILKEVARSLSETERVRANQPIASMTELDLEAEQLRLESLLAEKMLSVDDFRRLREIDFFLEGMRQRQHYGPAREEWSQERLSDD